jgi:hypothetical protein
VLLHHALTNFERDKSSAFSIAAQVVVSAFILPWTILAKVDGISPIRLYLP